MVASCEFVMQFGPGDHQIWFLVRAILHFEFQPAHVGGQTVPLGLFRCVDETLTRQTQRKTRHLCVVF
jgi:hypothetical protein